MKPRRLHSDTIFSICKFSLGSAIKSVAQFSSCVRRSQVADGRGHGIVGIRRSIAPRVVGPVVLAEQCSALRPNPLPRTQTGARPGWCFNLKTEIRSKTESKKNLPRAREVFSFQIISVPYRRVGHGAGRRRDPAEADGHKRVRDARRHLGRV